MAEFTKGPWGVSAHTNIWITAGNLHVATVPRATDGNWSPANAHLIASAPELYEACKSLLPILESVRYTAGLGKNQMARVEAAKAAIAKAEGR